MVVSRNYQFPRHLGTNRMSSTLANICVTEQEIDESPSRRDGISVEVETLLRRYGCELCDDLGNLLDLYVGTLCLVSQPYCLSL